MSEACIECGSESGSDARRHAGLALCAVCIDGMRDHDDHFPRERIAATFKAEYHQRAMESLADDPTLEDYLEPFGDLGLPIYTALDPDTDVFEGIVSARAEWLCESYDLDDNLGRTIAYAEAGGYTSYGLAKKVDVTPSTTKKYMDAIDDEFGDPKDIEASVFTQPPFHDFRRPLPSDDPDKHDQLDTGVDVDLTGDWREFPPEMISRRQWCCWSSESRTNQQGEKYTTKVPKMPWDSAAEDDPTDAANLTTFARADDFAEKVPGWGVGFAFHVTDPFVGIDFDDCRVTDERDVVGDIDDWVMEIVERADSFTQISTSGTGLHVIVRGTLPSVVKNKEAGIEMYDRKRFFAMTGDHLHGTPVETRECQDLLDELHEEYKTGTDGRNYVVDNPQFADRDYEPRTPFEELTITDVYDIQTGVRVSHPVHGSSRTGANFIVEANGRHGTCWRCDYGSGQGCGINVQQMLAMEATGIEDCGEMKRRWQDEDRYVLIAWLYAKQNLGVDLGTDPPPYRAIRHVDEQQITGGKLQDGGKPAKIAYNLSCDWLQREHGVDIDHRDDRKGKIV